ncbi:hypothetical protein F4604DRAFT_1677831 [Suillus subluteus]|nr:hypothetical protein F4604DRAFT_1677831 [Suillus subluteus]
MGIERGKGNQGWHEWHEQLYANDNTKQEATDLKGCADKVEDLLKSHKYIFPTDAKGKVLGDQPFCDEATIDTIRLTFFDGEDSFGDENDEPELPVAMIYAILKDWSSGNLPSSAQVKSVQCLLPHRRLQGSPSDSHCASLMVVERSTMH